MKTRALFLLIGLFLSWTKVYSADITAVELARKLRGADTPKSSAEAIELAVENIGLVVEILRMPSGDSLVRRNCVGILHSVSFNERFPSKEFFQLISDLYFRIRRNPIDNAMRKDEENLLENNLVHFGYIPGGTSHLPFKSNFLNLFHLIQGLKASAALDIDKKVENELLEKGLAKLSSNENMEIIKELVRFNRIVQKLQSNDDAKRILIRYVENLVSQVKAGKR